MKSQVICNDVICNNINTRKKFFLLMIVPLLIGLMISFTNAARAEWDSNDHVLQSPLSQGWKPIKIYTSPDMQLSLPKKKLEKKSWWHVF